MIHMRNHFMVRWTVFKERKTKYCAGKAIAELRGIYAIEEAKYALEADGLQAKLKPYMFIKAGIELQEQQYEFIVLT
jgi:hypothetical protein